MAMVVQHNMQAMNSARMLGITSNAQAKSTEKLSSGYKINRAADDAAGLSISEKMRKQMRGLDRASTNAQDGVSAVQTAEGALTEVHDMLQRMNELAVQASNGTNSQSDRESIQNEVDQLTTEIDRVSETTKFNEMYLLKGNSDPTQKKTVTMKGHDAGLDKLRDATNYSQTIADQSNDSISAYQFTVDMSKLQAGSTVNIGGKDYTIVDAVEQANADGKIHFDKTNTNAIKDGVVATDDSKITQGKAIQLIGEALSKANYIGDSTAAAQKVYNIDGKAEGTDNVAVQTAEKDDYDKNLNKWDSVKDKNVKLFKDASLDGQTNLVAEKKVVFTVKKATNETQQALNFNLHVGADADMNNKIGVGIEEMSSKYLGVKGLDVVGKDKDGNNTNDGGIAATYAIDAIADAVAKVSAQRSSLGAVQNRLEHTINNVDNVVENTTSAESRIRDTDMADEMVTYSKNNILAQAGQSMLAQANQSTQGVLSLLG